MRRTLYYVIGIGLVAYGWNHYRQSQRVGLGEAAAGAEAEAGVPPAVPAVERPDEPVTGYRCDGRVYCSQMHSCQEATWMLQHCPGLKMDGDRDGVPCEDQWCGH